MVMILATHLWLILPENRMSGVLQLELPGRCGLGVVIVVWWCLFRSYEYLRMAFSDLRGQLMHLTGKVLTYLTHPPHYIIITSYYYIYIYIGSTSRGSSIG